MTGPEHYIEAEKLTTLAAQSGREQPAWAFEYLAAAQVHATLALAAATAMNGCENGMHKADFDAWDEAAGVPEDRAAE